MSASLRPKVIFICGMHASGKTTVLHELHKTGLLDEVHYEIGTDLFYRRQLDTENQSICFEHEITDLELSRDKKLTSSQSVIGIETWHPGNLVFMVMWKWVLFN